MRAGKTQIAARWGTVLVVTEADGVLITTLRAERVPNHPRPFFSEGRVTSIQPNCQAPTMGQTGLQSCATRAAYKKKDANTG